MSRIDPLSAPVQWGLLALVMVVTTLAYLPGLSGGFVFDDFTNILDYPPFRQIPSSLAGWWELATSMQAGPTRRPLSMLGFGLQVASTGFDPFPFKAVNLAIHLANGLLLFLLLHRLVRRLMNDGRVSPVGGAGGVALAVTAAWLLSPVNLTAVLYVVQRMESLAFLFTLLGLLGYLWGRERMLDGHSGGLALCWTSLLSATILGSLFKESAVLTPLYALIMEWILYGFRNAQGYRDKRILLLFGLVLLAPFLLGAAWWLPRFLAGYESRDFTLEERLLTEARVIWTYVGWILFPRLEALGLYHDDFPLSTGILAPWTTLLSILGLMAISLLAVVTRRAFPLVSLGILLFLAAHLLTGTMVPLELVYEHRNYPASAGLWISVMALVLHKKWPMREIRALFVACLVVLGGVLTAIRAATWGNPLLLAMTAASQHPRSMRANYDLAYTLLLIAEGPDDPRFHLALSSLKTASRLPGAGLLPAHAAIWVLSKHGDLRVEEWWVEFEERVKRRRSAADRNVLRKMLSCVTDKGCVIDGGRFGKVLLAAYRSHSGDALITTYYADYAVNYLHDYSLGLRLMQEAVAISPRDRDLWANLVALQISLGHKSEAAYGLERLWELGRHLPAWQRRVGLLERYAKVFGEYWQNPYARL